MKIFEQALAEVHGSHTALRQRKLTLLSANSLASSRKLERNG